MIRQRQSYPTRFHDGTSREAAEAGIEARQIVWEYNGIEAILVRLICSIVAEVVAESDSPNAEAT